IFDRRGNGTPYYPTPSREQATNYATDAVPQAAPAEAAVSDQAKTVLVYKDGHKAEIADYAIVGDTLYDLTDGRRHKIPLADLDLGATQQQNQDLGNDSEVPAGAETN